MADDGDKLEAERLSRLEELFFGVLDQPEERRSAYLDQACGSDAAQRAAVEAMLRADGRPGGVIDDGSWRAPRLAQRLGANGDGDPLAVPGAVIGGYRLVERVGVGGMGTVWRAQRSDEAFERTVALKLIKHGLDSGDIVRRFTQERRVLARLEHPHIARLYDGGAAADGRPYLVMEYIDGVPVTDYCRDNGLTFRDVLDLACRIGQAVHFAHSHLVVHRDLKPSNILIARGGEPKLLDFGIAKLLDSERGADAAVTSTRQRLLTPRYASPEQVRGGPISTASDVYSLGVVLYELLTGCLPYQLATDSQHELERAIVEQEPARPSAIVARGQTGSLPESTARNRRRAGALRGDLDTIVLTALRKEPERRYASAAALVADIERYLRHDTIAARPDTWRYRVGTFARRNRTLVAAVAALFGVVGVGLAASLVQYERAEHARALAVDERDAAEWNLYVASIAAAEGALTEAYYPQKALRNLQRAPERFRDWEWRFLRSRVDRSLIDPAPTDAGDRKMRVAWQPRGNMLACGENQSASRLRIYDGRTGERIADLGRIHNARISHLAFAPDGTRLATIAADASFALWRVEGNDLKLHLKHTFQPAATTFAFGSDGRTLYVPCVDGAVRAFAVEPTRLVERWAHRSGIAEAPSVSNVSDAGLLAVGLPTSLVVLDAEGGDVLRSTDAAGRPNPIRVTDEGRVVAVVGRDVLTWDVATLALLDSAAVRTTHAFYKRDFHPDGRRLAFQPDRTQHFVLYDLSSESIETEYHGYREFGIVFDLAFSDDAERVAVASWERTLETWDVSGTPCVRQLRWQRDGAAEPEHFTSIDTPPAGSWIVAGSAGGASLWEPRTGLRVGAFARPGQGAVGCVRFRPDGKRFAASGKGAVHAWDTASGALLWSHARGSPHPESLSSSPDGRYLAIVEETGQGGVVRLLDWGTGEVVRAFADPPLRARCVQFSHDGQRLACGASIEPTNESRVVVWDVETGEVVRELAGFGKLVETLAWSPDGSTLAAGGYRHEVWRWSMIDGRELPRPRFDEGGWRTRDLRFTPDGRRLIVANSSDALALWDVEHAQEIIGLGFISGALGIAFPDDLRWIAVGARWNMTIWDTAAPAERVAAEVVRRRYDESPDDWPRIADRIEGDRWLTDAQRGDARELVRKLRR